MSLDARIRQLAAEIIAEAGDGDGVSPARVAELEKLLADHQAQMKDLHDHLHRSLTRVDRLAARVETLETAPPDAAPAETGTLPRRTGSRRKTGDS
jgi:hypothetical protein